MGKITGLLKILKEEPKKNILAAGLLVLLVATIKDNVHYGYAALDSPQGNHYIWGIAPTTKISGDVKGNVYTIGLVFGVNEVKEDTEITGNISACSLVYGQNDVGNDSRITGDMTICGFIGGNRVGKDSIIRGDMSGYALIIGKNEAGKDSRITGDITSTGIFAITPLSYYGYFFNQTKGLENYVVK